MSAIRERVIVGCPYGQAQGYLDYYLRTLGKELRAKAASLRLDVLLSDLGLPGNLVVSRRAVATFAPIIDTNHREHRIAVHWAPEGGGPFPRFSGFIVMEAHESYRTSLLTLEGDYHPPFGVAGKVFDAALGKKIASATARQLLATLQNVLEQKQRDDYAPPTIPAPQR